MEEGKSMRPSIWLKEELTDEKLRGPGWEEIGTRVFVPQKYEFEYAIEHCAKSIPKGFGDIEWEQDFKDALVAWFYSGNWMWVGEENDGTN